MATNVQRLKPLSVTDFQRRWMVGFGTGQQALTVREVVFTSDQQRCWRGDGTMIGPQVDHGSVASAAAMAEIHLAAGRGVYPLDTCYRIDEGREYRVISGDGATAVWRAAGAGSSDVAGAQPLDADLTAIAAQGVSLFGLSWLALSGAADAKNALSLTPSDVAGLVSALGGKWSTPANAAVLAALSDIDGALAYAGSPISGGTSGGGGIAEKLYLAANYH